MSTNQNANPSLLLLLGGAEHTIPATLLPPIQSRHTGLGIARYQLEFTVHGRETSDELTAEISRARVATSPISESGTDRKFVVENHSYSYSGDDRSDVSHSMSLRELESPRAEAVEFLGYRLQPEEYREDAEDGSPLVVGMVVTIAEGDVAGFEDALHAARWSEESPYFPVIRVGVSENPISMRFGQCVWEERDGARRHMLYLVSEENDELKRRGLGSINEPRLSRIQDQTEKNTTRLEGLLEVLGSTGTLDAETVARILAMEPSSQSYRFAERTKNVEVDWMD